ncbi:MAG: hypothetical protein CMJ18_06405 [Phycisphaeraceae bacterium]|nr:hypothetical protein [Phycisphaeraceae bacterium]
MTETHVVENQHTYRRAATASAIGLFVQLVLSVAMALLGLWSESPALYGATFHLLGGLPIWLILLLIYNQHRLERIEALESQQLAQSEGGTSIFDEGGVELNISRRRLDNLYRWGLGIVSVFVAVYLIVLGASWLYLASRPEIALLGPRALAMPQALLVTAVAGAFVAFIVARYVSGMTRIPYWQMLRGGAGYLMSTALIFVLTAAAGMLQWMNVPHAFDWLARVVPVLMIILGVEVVLTFLLSAYRPRRPGESPRPAFDSRMLGLLTSPESIAKTIGDTLNYQFGFEISRSWFYQLLSQATPSLVGLAALIMIFSSSVVVVDPHEEAIITRFGHIQGIEGPGLTLKQPWPIGRAYRFPVDRVHEISAGSVRGLISTEKPILWTTPHTAEDEQYLITGASVTTGADDRAEPSESQRGIALVAANVKVQFRVRDLRRFATSATDPLQLIRAMEQRERWDRRRADWLASTKPTPNPLEGKVPIDPCPLLTAVASGVCSAHFAGAEIDSLLAEGRLESGGVLKDRVQQEVDRLGLGLEVLFVGMAGIHPPQKGDVAAAFHEQISAQGERQSAIEKAERERIGMLAQVAGSTEQAIAIHDQIRKIEQAISEGRTHDALHQKVNELLAVSQGEAAEVLYAAYADRWQHVVGERSKASRFEAMLEGYRLAPEYFQMRMYYQVLAEGLAEARKIIVPSSDIPTTEIRLDLKDQGTLPDFLNPD